MAFTAVPKAARLSCTVRVPASSDAYILSDQSIFVSAFWVNTGFTPAFDYYLPILKERFINFVLNALIFCIKIASYTASKMKWLQNIAEKLG